MTSVSFPVSSGFMIMSFTRPVMRRISQNAPQRALERLGVLPDLALVDDRAVVAVEELDRVLDRDDVLRVEAVDLVDHRREGGALTRTGRTGQEDDAALLVGDLRDDLG